MVAKFSVSPSQTPLPTPLRHARSRTVALFCSRTLAGTRPSPTLIVGGNFVGGGLQIPLGLSFTSSLTFFLGGVSASLSLTASCILFALTSSHLSSCKSSTDLSVMVNTCFPFNKKKTARAASNFPASSITSNFGTSSSRFLHCLVNKQSAEDVHLALLRAQSRIRTISRRNRPMQELCSCCSCSP